MDARVGKETFQKDLGVSSAGSNQQISYSTHTTLAALTPNTARPILVQPQPIATTHPLPGLAMPAVHAPSPMTNLQQMVMDPTLWRLFETFGQRRTVQQTACSPQVSLPNYKPSLNLDTQATLGPTFPSNATSSVSLSSLPMSHNTLLKEGSSKPGQAFLSQPIKEEADVAIVSVEPPRFDPEKKTNELKGISTSPPDSENASETGTQEEQTNSGVLPKSTSREVGEKRSPSSSCSKSRRASRSPSRSTYSYRRESSSRSEYVAWRSRSRSRSLLRYRSSDIPRKRRNYSHRSQRRRSRSRSSSRSVSSTERHGRERRHSRAWRPRSRSDSGDRQNNGGRRKGDHVNRFHGYRTGITTKQYWDIFYKYVAPIPISGVSIISQAATDGIGTGCGNFERSIDDKCSARSAVADMNGCIACPTCSRLCHGEDGYQDHLLQHEPFIKLDADREVCLKSYACLTCKSFSESYNGMQEHVKTYHREKNNSSEYQMKIVVMHTITPPANPVIAATIDASDGGHKRSKESAVSENGDVPRSEFSRVGNSRRVNKNGATQTPAHVTKYVDHMDVRATQTEFHSGGKPTSASQFVVLDSSAQVESPMATKTVKYTRDNLAESEEDYFEGSMKCTHCAKQFVYPGSLTSHELRCQGGGRRGYSQKDNQPKAPEKNKSTTKITCNICNLKCAGKGAYRMHSQTHENVDLGTGLVKRFSCKKCHTYYALSAGLYQHNKIYHQEGLAQTKQ